MMEVDNGVGEGEEKKKKMEDEADGHVGRNAEEPHDFTGIYLFNEEH